MKFKLLTENLPPLPPNAIRFEIENDSADIYETFAVECEQQAAYYQHLSVREFARARLLREEGKRLRGLNTEANNKEEVNREKEGVTGSTGSVSSDSTL